MGPNENPSVSDEIDPADDPEKVAPQVDHPDLLPVARRRGVPEARRPVRDCVEAGGERLPRVRCAAAVRHPGGGKRVRVGVEMR